MCMHQVLYSFFTAFLTRFQLCILLCGSWDTNPIISLSAPWPIVRRSIFFAGIKLYKSNCLVKASHTERLNLTRSWGLTVSGGSYLVQRFQTNLTPQATTDAPCVCFADDLLRIYPNAKVIHTDRDPDKWIASVERSFFSVLEWREWNWLRHFHKVSPTKNYGISTAKISRDSFTLR